MEQKRTLWIVAAAGIFLLVVVGAALLLYSPSLHKNEQIQTYYNPQDGWVNGPKQPVQFTSPAQNAAPAPQEIAPVQPVPASDSPMSANSGVKPLQAENVTVITDNAIVYGTNATTIDLNALKTSKAPVQPEQNDNIVAKNQYTADQMSFYKESSDKTVSSKPDSYYAPAAAKTEVKKESISQPKPQAKPAPKKETVKPAPKAETKKAAPSKPALPDSFWIQVGSYAEKKSADEARSVLESNKIPSEVFTYKDSKGKLFYRVRVGPYTTKSEAEYWKTRISGISLFIKSNSYIVNANGKK